MLPWVQTLCSCAKPAGYFHIEAFWLTPIKELQLLQELL